MKKSFVTFLTFFLVIFAYSTVSSAIPYYDVVGETKVVGAGVPSIGTPDVLYNDIGIRASNNSNVTVSEDLKNIYSTGTSKHAIIALDTSKITVFGDLNINVNSTSYGVYGVKIAANSDKNIVFKGDVNIVNNTASFSTYGVNGGIYFEKNLNVTLVNRNNSVITGISRNVEINGDLNLSIDGGSSSWGLFEGVIVKGSAVISVKCTGAIGVDGTTNVNNQVSLGQYSKISVEGDNSNGARGYITLGDNTLILAEGYSCFGINGGKITGNNITIDVQGGNSVGIGHHSYIGNNIIINATGKTSRGAWNNIEFRNNVSINVDGDESVGALLNVTFGNDAAITTRGNKAYGAYQNITFNDNASITTYGISSYGAYNSVTFGDNAQITTSGDAALGAYYNVSFGDSATIRTSGKWAHAAAMYGDGVVTFGKNANILVTGEGSDVFYWSSTPTQRSLSFVSMIAISEKSNLVINKTGIEVSFNFSEKSTLKGDLLNNFVGTTNSISDEIINLNLDDSIWAGSKSGDNGLANLSLKNNSHWQIIKDSHIDMVDIDKQSRIDFLESNVDFFTAKIASIRGEGDFYMNVNLEERPLADRIAIKDATGSYLLTVRHTNDSCGDDVLMITAERPVDFNVTLFVDELEIGLYTYKLKSEKNDTEWWLKSSFTNGGKQFFAGFLGLVQMGRALERTVFDEINRTHEQIWVLPFYNKQTYTFEVEDEEYKIEQNIYGVFSGLDNRTNLIKDKSKGSLYVGEYIGLFFGDQVSLDKYTSSLESCTAGVYVDYELKNFWVNSYIRYGFYRQFLWLEERRGITKVKGIGHSCTVSLSTGYKFDILDSLYIEPSIGMTYVFFTEMTYDFNNLKKIPVSADKSFIVTAGGKIGYVFETQKADYDIHAIANVLYDVGNSGLIKFDEKSVDVNFQKIRFEFGGGLSVIVERGSFFFDIKSSISRNIKENIKIEVGFSAPY